MPERLDPHDDWLGRLVRVLVVFRALVLLVTVMLLPGRRFTPVVGIAVVLAAAISYVPLKYWDRVGRSISRHPLYLAAEVLLATLILAAVGARSSFFFFTLGTAALAGVVYGRRGALPFSALLISAYELVALEGLPSSHPLHDVASVGLVPMLYPAAVAAGVAARELIQRGAETESLLRDRNEALATERERLRVARELHDSLAKTVEGLAMSASVLPSRCVRNPDAAAVLARQLATDAHQAALEARALMTDLRPGAQLDIALDEAVRRRAEEFQERSGIPVSVSCDTDAGAGAAGDELSAAAKHELLRILGEALINGQVHARASSVAVSLRRIPEWVELSIADNGCGLPEPIDLRGLKAAGHFGLAGMHERARELGGALRVESGPDGGTIVTARVPASSGAREPETGDRLDPRSGAGALRPGRRRKLRSARARA